MFFLKRCLMQTSFVCYEWSLYWFWSKKIPDIFLTFRSRFAEVIYILKTFQKRLFLYVRILSSLFSHIWLIFTFLLICLPFWQVVSSLTISKRNFNLIHKNDRNRKHSQHNIESLLNMSRLYYELYCYDQFLYSFWFLTYIDL